MITGLEHVAIFAEDTAALKDWYVKVFEFKVAYDNGKGTFFLRMPDGSMTEICKQTEPNRKDGLSVGGLRHLAFETDDFDGQALVEVQAEDVPNNIVYDFIEWMEACRQKYNETKDKRYWKELVRWLPNGWLQTRTVTMNYENLVNIYYARRFHKLDEWHTVCAWIETLPYAKEFILGIEKKD